MHLPEIEMICLQQTQRRLEFLVGLLRRALYSLGREEDVVPNSLKADAVSLFRTSVPVQACTIEIGDAEVIYPANVRRRGLNVGMEIHSGSALRDDAYFCARLAEDRGGNIARLRFLRCRKRARDGHAGECAAYE